METDAVSQKSSSPQSGMEPPHPFASSPAFPPGMVTRLPLPLFQELQPFLAAYKLEAEDVKIDSDSDAVQTFLQLAATAAPALMATLGDLGGRAPLLAVVASALSAAEEQTSASGEPRAAHSMYTSIQSTASLLLAAQTSHQLQALYAQQPLDDWWIELQRFVSLLLTALRDGNLSSLWTDSRYQAELRDIQRGVQAAEQRLLLALGLAGIHAAHRLEHYIKALYGGRSVQADADTAYSNSRSSGRR